MERITPIELKEFSEITDSKLAPSPIDVERHKRQAEGDPMLEKRLNEMLDCCFEYTKDVAHHEHLRRSGKDFEVETASADAQRAETHNKTIEAIMSYRNALDDKKLIKTDGAKLELIPTSSQSRAAFGKFALLLTLNRFKEQITLVKKFSREGIHIDYEKLKGMTQNEQDLLIIEYVQITSSIYEKDDIENPPAVEVEDRLHTIEDTLGLDEGTIFQNFIRIYEKGYLQE